MATHTTDKPRITYSPPVEDQIKTRPSVPAEVAFAALNIGRTTGYAALRDGRIPSIRLGANGKYAIPRAWLRAQLGITD